MRPAILLVELDSIAVGIRVGDAMAKRAPLATLHAGTVHPGKYLVLAGGEVGDVEEAWAAGREAAAGSLRAELFLPEVHPAVVAALCGARGPVAGDALGVIETRTVASTLHAADAGVKGAEVALAEVRLADGLGGKAYLLFAGAVADVEAAVEIACDRVPPGELVARVVIPRLAAEMADNLEAAGEFARRVRGEGAPG